MSMCFVLPLQWSYKVTSINMIITYIPSKYVNMTVLLVPLQLVVATSIVCLALYGRVSVVSLICEVVVIMLVPLMV